MLKLVQINPMEMYPDELLLKIRRYIRNGNYKLVLIDSLRGYILAMEEFGIGTLMLHLHNLITYLNYAQVTTFLINEIEAITGNLKVTEYGLSRFGDNIILLRFSERSSNVIKIIGCLKKRLGNFQPEFREISITSKGITLSKKLNNVGV